MGYKLNKAWHRKREKIMFTIKFVIKKFIYPGKVYQIVYHAKVHAVDQALNSLGPPVQISQMNEFLANLKTS